MSSEEDLDHFLVVAGPRQIKARITKLEAAPMAYRERVVELENALSRLTFALADESVSPATEELIRRTHAVLRKPGLR